ncbi:MAG: DUF5703 domain-containing protein [Planctomycetota bacterium]|nr:DUF5703 domain-containing protein [Planctomycetota bacterium]
MPRFLMVMFVILMGQANPFGADVSRYNIVWNSPSKDHGGSMPLGNGATGLNAWINPAGELEFYISRTDSWGDNGRLLKVGKVRLTLDPAPPVEPFEQTLSLIDGTMVVRYGPANSAITLKLWVDANHPVIHIAVSGPQPVTATAAIELWRTKPHNLSSIQCSSLMEDRSKPGRLHQPVIMEPDTILTGQTNRIGWYHHNRKSVGPSMIATIQGLADFKRADPLLHRTFGAIIVAENGRRIDDTHLQASAAKSHRFSIYVDASHPATAQQWLRTMEETIASTEAIPFAQRRQSHEQWWSGFWNRSWINAVASKKVKRVRPSLIPANTHPVKIGVDQSGHYHFGGQIGRVSILSAALSDKEVEALFRREHDKGISHGNVLFSGRPKQGDALPDSKAWSFAGGVTIEAWVKDARGGRIVDKITPGGKDGFLLDTYPGNSLRLIVGEQTFQKPNALPAGKWTHVAAVVNSQTGQIRTFVNGKVITDRKWQTGHPDEAQLVSGAYALQRYISACAGRGRYPIKFNGSIFTVPHAGDPDFRRWGPGYWWQNTRLPYLSMCTSGDYEMMRPLFRMYATELMPLHKYRTRLQTGADGAFIPECIYFWGDQFSATYGWKPLVERGEDKLQESGWHKWEWVSGPELVFMMLDCFEHTLDETFLKETLLPSAHEILTFFVSHYQTNDAGKLVMHPSMACETWWACTNPMPELAGLHAVSARLLALPEDLTTAEQRAFWQAVQKKLPDLPTRKAGETLALAPAAKFANKRNMENPELYAVFPFRLVSFEKPNAKLGLGALKHRWDKGNFGWRQDDLFMAYLGLADDARKYLVGRARNHHKGSRFPAFWGPNYNWVPDQDHGGVLTKTLQTMLMQTDPYSNKVYLLPAWPRDWNVKFKLHAPRHTTIEGEYRDGAMKSLKVLPESRRADVVVVESPTTAN